MKCTLMCKDASCDNQSKYEDVSVWEIPMEEVQDDSDCDDDEEDEADDD